MENINRAEQAFESEIMIAGSIDMASAAGVIGNFMNYESFDGMEDLIDSLVYGPGNVDPSIKPLADHLSQHVDGVDDEQVLENISEVIHSPELLGICLKVHTPRVESLGKGLQKVSWGIQTVNWVYGESYEKAWERAVEWVQEKRQGCFTSQSS